jgi:hypothetical protein
MNKTQWVPEFAAGAAIGLLVGLIAGLSISPVTQMVLGSLSAGLLVLLGLKKENDPSQARIHALRVLGFGLVCATSLVAGIFVRTHFTLSPDLASQKQRLTDAKVFTPDQITQILLLTNFGIHSDGQTTNFQGGTAPENNVAEDKKSKGEQARPGGPNDPLPKTDYDHSAALVSAGFLRAGSKQFCDLARRSQFRDLKSYLDQVHRLDPKLYQILQSAPVDYKDQLSNLLDGYLCP